MGKTIGFIITAGHLDIEWYQPLNSYRFWTVEALEDLKEAAKRSDFKTYVLDGQVFPLEEYLEVVPQDEAYMKELIQQGKLAVGPFYTQFDEWLPSAENMIRNCLYGKRKAKTYGGYMRAGYLPDNFGHPRQIPQILNNFGIDSLMFMRGMPEMEGEHPDEFIYKGIDGSEVLVSHFRESYSGAFDIFHKGNDPIQPREVPYYSEYLSYEYHKELAWHDDPERTAKNMIANVHRIKERYPSDVIALIAGFDHLPPQINIGETVKMANDMQDDIEFVMGNAEEYVELVKSRIANPTVYNMELIGSKYQNILLGAVSTRSYLKRQNFACEALLEKYAEPLDAIASMYDYPDKPTLLNEAWRYLMINSAHDSIHGSSTDEVHVEMEARNAKCRQIGAGIIHDAMAHLGKRTKRWWEKLDEPFAKGLLTYSPESSNGLQPTELWLPIGDAPVQICDVNGNLYPTQILQREPIDINAIGKVRNDAFPHAVYRKVVFMYPGQAGMIQTFAAIPKKEEQTPMISAGDTFMENELVKVQVTNSCISLTDKRTGKTFYNLNVLEEEADAGDAWDFSPTWLPGEMVRSTSFVFNSRLKECGPVRAVLEVKGEMSVPESLIVEERSQKRVTIPITYELTLWSGMERVDVKLTLDNRAKDHRIRLRIPANLQTDHVLSQGHLAIIDRPIERQKPVEKWYQPPTQLLPCREWVAMQDEKDGLAIALKGMYDYEAIVNPLTQEPDLYITLLRGIGMMGRLNMIQREGGASDAVSTPGAQCLGEQVMEWSYIPYQVTSEEKAQFITMVHNFLYPAVAHAIRSECKAEMFEELQPLVSWEPKNIQFSAFKKCLNRDGYILRFFENQGKKTKVSIKINGFEKAWQSNMDEATLESIEIKNGCIELEVLPYKAISIKLR